VVEVGVADEHADDVARRSQVALVERRVDLWALLSVTG
jgi:hypothetical protein